MSAYDYLFNDRKYKVKKSKIILPNGMDAYRFHCEFLDISDMLFLENDPNGFIPFMMNFKVDAVGNATGDRILKNTIEHDFIESIGYVLQNTNPKTGRLESGNMSILQWYFGLNIVSSSIKYEKNRWTEEVNRQFGKTFKMSHIAGFLPVFAPLYADLPNDRWWQIIASYTDESVVELFDLKTKPIIFKNIELFNKKHPNNPLIINKFKTENYVNNKNKLEIRRIIRDEAIPFSYIVALSTNKVSDGKSSDWIWLDEGWRTPLKEFRRGILPFLGSTSGDLVVSGITTIENDNMQYDIHFNVKDSKKIVSNVFSTYNFLMHDYPRRAKALRLLAEEEFDASGLESSESQTNYIMTWDILEGKFYSLDWLRKNNNFSRTPSLQAFDDNCEFRVAGLDLATINDFCVLTIFDVYQVQKTTYDTNTGQKEYRNVWKYKTREIITYNLDRIPISAESVAKKTASYCKSYEIDMLLCDGTTSQRTHNEWILKELKNGEINTQLCPYDFSGDKNKILLMVNFEQSLKSGLIDFGSEEEYKNHTTVGILIKEIISLYKGFEKGKKNIQYKAKGKGNTDDHVMSTALGVYCIPYIEYLIKNNKDIVINSYSYKPKLNKYKKEPQKKIKKKSSWLGIY